MTFYEKFCALCAERGLKPHARDTAEKIGITNGAVSFWKKGGMPKAETLEKIARFFGVSADYLLSESDGRELINGDPELTEFLEMLATREECRMLFHLSKTATKEDVELAVKIIEQLRDRDK